jgi:1-deoxy-D-xylulose-5-phosphate synthase
VEPLLDSIHSPSDLKGLDFDALEQLTREIRERLIEAVSRTGGHLAANLGVVELTIALHRALDCPRDRVVWDVGHQCYTHKLLTGRRDRLDTLRQWGGLCGFPSREESEYDVFNTGHGSTSIAAALGLATARELRGSDETIVAVIGDGAMGGGMAFEALNAAGHQKTDLIVILNDNEMSISPNVGALAGYLARLRMDPHYLKAKAQFEQMMQRWPGGGAVVEAVERLKASVKQLLVPGMLFEVLGFTYLGPIDGHDLRLTTETIEHAKTLEGPVLIHVVTQKGRGYYPAERDACRYHGIPPFDVESGEPAIASSGLSYTAVFGRTLVQLAESDERIVAVTAAMRDGTGLREFSERFPSRFFDVGMAEQHAVTFGAGLAAAGLRPVVAVYSTFLQRAYDQVLHDVCHQNLPVVLAIDRGGVVGEDGATHQGVFDLAYLRHMPNLVLMAPRDLSDLAAMLRTALAVEGPAALRYPRGIGMSPPDGLPEPIPVGKGELLLEGSDVALLAVGVMVGPAFEAARMLQEQGISAAVADARFVKPLDDELITALAGRCGALLTVEDNVAAGGFGSAVLELLAASGVRHLPVRCLGIPDEPVRHGARSRLLEAMGLTAEGIAHAARSVVESRSLGPG